MKNSKWITMAAVLTLSASLAVAAPHGEGKGKGRHGRHHGEMFSERLAQKLNLTEAQKGQIKSLNQSFREQNRDLFEQNRATMQQFRDAKKAGDTARMESLKPAMQQFREQMKQRREAQHAQILTLLTPDQRAQWDALKAERAERHKNRGNR